MNPYSLRVLVSSWGSCEDGISVVLSPFAYEFRAIRCYVDIVESQEHIACIRSLFVILMECILGL